MKKYLGLLIIFIMLFIMVGCADDSTGGTRTLPNLDGMSREEIKEVLDKENINYLFKFSDKIVFNDEDMNKFVSYNGSYKAGDKISSNYQVYVYTTVLPLTFDNTSEAVMDFEYKGKSFINDGVGVVTLERAIDGDTAWFVDQVTGESFKLRFLGIDTPESTIDKDPWGKAASNYSKKRLEEATEIVIEGEGSRTETYGRYLGFVWVDGVLLNLELINQAYTNSTLSGSKYETLFSEASKNAKTTGRRFFGETDPNYDYVNKKFK